MAPDPETIFSVLVVPLLLFILSELAQLKRSNRELAERLARLEGKLEIVLEQIRRDGGGES